MFGRKHFDVFTHHKCASSWLLAYLRDVAARNDLDISWTHCSERLPDTPARGGDIRVFLNADYAFVRRKGLRGIHLVRSPLAILCSAYHSHLRTHHLDFWPELRRQRAILQNGSNRDGYLLTMAFLERLDFGQSTVGPFRALRSWDLADRRFATLRMEDAVDDVVGTIGAAVTGFFGAGLELPDDADFAFSRFAGGRSVGKIDDSSHYRCGDPLHWRRELPDAAITYVATEFSELLERHYPEQLRLVGERAAKPVTFPAPCEEFAA